jgi:hypothetical protein
VNQVNTATPGSKKIIRVVGNAGNTPYLIGTTVTGQPLEDGITFNVPKGVTVMIDAGAVLKLRAAIIDVGSSQPLASSSRAEAALKVLGVPGSPVTFTSYHDDSIGGNTDGFGPAASGGQWGGLVFRQDSDAPSKRAFVNTVQQGEFRYGGGQVRVDSQPQSFTPIQVESTRPTITFNTITGSAGAAIAATPNSFEESNGRIGPEIRGNRLVGNSTNGLFVKIFTRSGSPLEQLDVPARFKSTDIVYVIQENLVISGGAGGYTLDVAPGREPTADGIGIAGEHLGDRRLEPSRADGMPLEQPVDWPDRGQREQERHGDPREPLLEQAPQAPAAIHEHREVAAEQEEQRHAEAVDGERQERQQAARLRVVHGPWTLIERQARVHDDPKGHRKPAEGVEVVAALDHGVAPVGLPCMTAPNRLCCRGFPAPGKA